MDNFTIAIEAQGDATLAKALEIAFTHNAPGGKATHYSVVRLLTETRYYAHSASDMLPENLDKAHGLHVHHSSYYRQDEKGHLTLMLLWSWEKGARELPYPMKIEDAIAFVKGWLANVGDPGPSPDIDGDLGRGWRVFTEAWGHVAGCSYAICGVQAIHAMYGK